MKPENLLHFETYKHVRVHSLRFKEAEGLISQPLVCMALLSSVLIKPVWMTDLTCYRDMNHVSGTFQHSQT